jgi:Fibronectin type III domain
MNWSMPGGINRRNLLGPVILGFLTLSITTTALAMNDNKSTVPSSSGTSKWDINNNIGTATRRTPTGVDAHVALPNVSGELKVVEFAGYPYVTDQSGKLMAIDPVQLKVGAETQLPQSDTQVVGGGGRLYIVAPRTGTATEIDPVNLQPIGKPVLLGGAVGDGTVDDDGVLWLPTISGAVVKVNGESIVDTKQLGEADRAVQLSMVNDSVVGTDGAAGKVTVLSGRFAGTTLNIGSASGPKVVATRTVHGRNVLPLLNADHLLTLADLEKETVKSVSLGRPDSGFGFPVLAENRVYVPDYSTGQLIIVDIDSVKIVKIETVTGRPGKFEVVEVGGRIFINDPNSADAWTMDGNGDLVKVQKYDPSKPNGAANVAGSIPPKEAPTVPTPSSAPPTTVPGDNSKPSTPTTTAPPPEPKIILLPPEVPQAAATTTTLPPPANTPPTTTPTTEPATATTTTTIRPIDVPTDTTPEGPGSTTTTRPGNTDGQGGGGAGNGTGNGGSGPSTENGAVRGLRASAADHAVTANWEAPSGWQQVASYSLELLPSGLRQNVDPDKRSYTFDGLDNGREFSVRVVANGEQGPGVATQSNAVTPNGPPAPPADVSLNATTNSITVTYSLDGRPGPAVTNVIVVVDGIERPQATSPLTISGLAAGSSYDVVIKLFGANGLSSSITKSISTLPGEPTQPVTPPRPPEIPEGRVTSTISGTTTTPRPQDVTTTTVPPDVLINPTPTTVAATRPLAVTTTSAPDVLIPPTATTTTTVPPTTTSIDLPVTTTTLASVPTTIVVPDTTTTTPTTTTLPPTTTTVAPTITTTTIQLPIVGPVTNLAWERVTLTGNAVDITWTAAPGATAYRVTINGTLVATVTATTYRARFTLEVDVPVEVTPVDLSGVQGTAATTIVFLENYTNNCQPQQGPQVTQAQICPIP